MVRTSHRRICLLHGSHRANTNVKKRLGGSHDLFKEHPQWPKFLSQGPTSEKVPAPHKRPQTWDQSSSHEPLWGRKDVSYSNNNNHEDVTFWVLTRHSTNIASSDP